MHSPVAGSQERRSASFCSRASRIDRQPIALGREPNARDVVLAFLEPDLHPGGLAVGEIEHADADGRVAVAGLRIGLRLDGGVDLLVAQQRVGGDAVLFEAQVGDLLAFGRPPEPDRAPRPDLLPVQPVGLAVEDLAFGAVLRQPSLLGAGDVDHPEVGVTHERDGGGVGREPRVLVLGRWRRQPSQRAIGEPVVVEVAGDLEQERLAVRRPDVVLERDLALAVLELAGAHQDRRLAVGLGRHRPEVALPFLRPQEGDAASVLGPRDLRGRSSVSLLGEDRLERERLGGASGGVAHDRGEDEAADRKRASAHRESGRRRRWTVTSFRSWDRRRPRAAPR